MFSNKALRGRRFPACGSLWWDFGIGRECPVPSPGLTWSNKAGRSEDNFSMVCVMSFVPSFVYRALHIGPTTKPAFYLSP